MAEIILRTDATFGLKLKVGDEVRRGDRVGVNSKTGGSVTSPICGAVKIVSFDAESHEFIVVVSAAKQNLI
ncbi:MAG: hypothetical protein JSV82_04440 [Planctomycetota bacterium]|nr:MAG: hypothetical protein JSV82_04440 [Planctomycetota bacterium]